MSFRLQHLPSLAYDEVIKCMDTFDILSLIDASRKTKKHVVTITKRLKTNLVLFMNEEKVCCTPCQKFDEELRPSEVLKKRSNEYSIEKFISVIESFNNVFCIKTISIHIETESSADPYLLWKYVKNQNLKIQKLYWEIEDLSIEKTKEVIEGSSDVDTLEMHFLKEPPVFSAVDLYPLITCKSVILFDINLTSENLNLFLKYWAVNTTTLFAIRIVVVEDLDRLVVLDGLKKEKDERANPESRRFETRLSRRRFTLKEL
uniref:F-box domain-containing protein n=1 Tax=Caenorhabditis tropicalis TaxID=1561998 RepID=A0A1I7UTB0_9PELO